MHMRKFNIVIVSLTLVLAVILAGCGRMASDPEAASPDGTESQPPFSGSKLSNLLSAKPSEPAITIPAGTALGVRLQNSLSSASANSGDRFDAVIDEPVVMNGTTVVPKGASATGRVVSAKSSGRLHKPGYLR